MKAFARERAVKIKLNKVAKYLFLRRVLKGCFEAMKRYRERQRSFKLVKKVLNHNLSYLALRRWKLEYLRTDISKTLTLRRNTALLFRSFHLIKTFSR